jgi:hypothetical protein
MKTIDKNKNEEKELGAIKKKVDKISERLEVLKLLDYVYYLKNPRKMFLANFIGGLARGFGIAIGFIGFTALLILFSNSVNDETYSKANKHEAMLDLKICCLGPILGG